MKTEVSTADQLVLRDRPVILGLGVVCAILIFSGIALNHALHGDTHDQTALLLLIGLFGVVFAVFVVQVVLVLQRSTGQVLIRRRSLFGTKEVCHDLANLRKAEVETSRDSSDGKNRITSRCVLQMKDGAKVPVTLVYSSGSGAKQAAEAINDWLNSG